MCLIVKWGKLEFRERKQRRSWENFQSCNETAQLMALPQLRTRPLCRGRWARRRDGHWGRGLAGDHRRRASLWHYLEREGPSSLHILPVGLGSGTRKEQEKSVFAWVSWGQINEKAYLHRNLWGLFPLPVSVSLCLSGISTLSQRVNLKTDSHQVSRENAVLSS